MLDGAVALDGDLRLLLYVGLLLYLGLHFIAFSPVFAAILLQHFAAAFAIAATAGSVAAVALAAFAVTWI